MEPRKQAILDALGAFVCQRSGMDYRNYGNVRSYRAEQRSITRDLHHYRELAAYVAMRESITADMLLEASRSVYSGRLILVAPNSDAAEGFNLGNSWRVDYCTGQYFPTEYRRAACAVLASAIWYYWREHCMPAPMIAQPTGNRLYMLGNGTNTRVSAGDWLRANARREFGRAVASRWFD